MTLIENIVAQARRLERMLNQALLRLPDPADNEALHDVRINLRRIRSLLRPLRGTPGVAQLDKATASLGKITTPLRDLEVLIAELEQHRLAWQANIRKTELQSRKLALLSLPLLTQIPILLHAWLKAFPITKQRHAKRHIIRRLTLQVIQLRRALADKQYDRHRLRLRVKRLRYGVDAYPQLSLLTPEAVTCLKTTQSALGNWHDRFAWCQKAENQQDLWPLLSQWQEAMEIARQNAEATLDPLSKVLDTTGKKHTTHHDPDQRS